jgi:hypothetical protein
MGREGALASFSVLGPSRSSVTAVARVAGTASRISAPKFRLAYARSAAVRHVAQVHARTLLLQLQHVAACNALHRVEGRLARWLLQLHDRVPDHVLPLTQDACPIARSAAANSDADHEQASRGGSHTGRPARLHRGQPDAAQQHRVRMLALMERRIDRMYCQELPVPQLALATLRESPIVASYEAGEDGTEIKAASSQSE